MFYYIQSVYFINSIMLSLHLKENMATKFVKYIFRSIYAVGSCNRWTSRSGESLKESMRGLCGVGNAMFCFLKPCAGYVGVLFVKSHQAVSAFLNVHYVSTKISRNEARRFPQWNGFIWIIWWLHPSAFAVCKATEGHYCKEERKTRGYLNEWHL